jgi:hypothetical protein
MSPYRTLPAALLTIGLGGCGLDPASTSAPDASAGPARDLVVVAQANVHGDIEPCG